MRHACEELESEGKELLEDLDERDAQRVLDLNAVVYDEWLAHRSYSPDTAEKPRAAARAKMYKEADAKRGVK
jgi:hypothetical protein